jgi:toxin ParE1/3/4
MARVILSPRAERDLKEISDYIAEQSDEDRADAVLRKISETMQLRAGQPLSDRRRDELKPGFRSFTVYRYVIFYQPLEDRIFVVRVVFGGRDLEALDFDEEDGEDQS